MGVKLEVFRMMLYLSFPVTMFWISNQPEYFEEYIVKRKRAALPPEKIKSLIHKYCKRLQAVIGIKGGNTRY
ncbi:protein PET100 homolog, mitochondrial [Lithobates pipiens]